MCLYTNGCIVCAIIGCIVCIYDRLYRVVVYDWLCRVLR